MLASISEHVRGKLYLPGGKMHERSKKTHYLLLADVYADFAWT
jgi:hypothetical protein